MRRLLLLSRAGFWSDGRPTGSDLMPACRKLVMKSRLVVANATVLASALSVLTQQAELITSELPVTRPFEIQKFDKAELASSARARGRTLKVWAQFSPGWIAFRQLRLWRDRVPHYPIFARLVLTE